MAYLLPLAAVMTAVWKRGWFPALIRSQPHALRLFGVIGVGLYLYACVVYLRSNVFLDHIEISVACIAAAFNHGSELYHDLATHQRYSLLYGPYLFIFVAASQKLLGASILSSKIPGVLAGCGALALNFWVARKNSSLTGALVCAGALAGVWLYFDNYTYWVRADSFLVFFVSAGVLAATWRSRWALIALGLCVGIAVDIKLHAFLYFIPAYALAWQNRPELRDHLAGVVAAVATAALPYLIFGPVSFHNHEMLLALIGKTHALARVEFLATVYFMGLILLPLLLFQGSAWLHDRTEVTASLKAERWFWFSLIGSIAITVVPSSKSGSGAHHLLPFLPFVVLAVSRVMQARVRSPLPPSTAAIVAYAMIFSWLISLSANAFYHVRFMSSILAKGSSQIVPGEIDTIIDQHPSSIILMASGSNESYFYATFNRAELAFRGMPIGLDIGSLMDLVESGVVVSPTAVSHEIETKSGKPVLWIVPKGNSPFTMLNYYPSNRPLISEEERVRFLLAYEAVGSPSHFDLYQLRTAAK